MPSSRVLVSLVSIALLTPACTDDGPSGDEVGDTGDSTTDDVSTFDDSSDSTSTSETEDATDTSESTETETAETTETETETAETTETESETAETTETETETTETDTTETETTETETTEGGEAPFVVTTSPADLATGVASAPSISVTFSEPMTPATVTTNSNNKECSGTVMVSFDNFMSCVQMQAQPTSDDDLTFTLEPAGPLQSATTYQIRVLPNVTDAEGTPMAAAFTTASGFTVRYYHTIVIDGVNDFEPDETFASSTLGHNGYVAWDETYVYLGMNSPDLGGNNSQIWFVAYLGGMPGSGSGVLYNTQQPLMPFDARWHLRWKASDDFGGALEWNGMAWINPGFGPIAGSSDVEASGSFVEMRVAWADLDNPDLLELHMGMLREQAFNEASWAAVPGNSYVDSYDPDYDHYYEFDVMGSTLPGDHDPI